MEYIITRNNNNDELYHYGVKGMKWGIRRYQNADGSLTPAGRRRNHAVENTPEAKAARNAKMKKAVKVGTVVLGTALAAYGGYKLAKHVQSTRNQAAMKKTRDYINANFMEKIGTSTMRDGSIQTHYSNGLHGPGTNSITLNARGSKVLGKQNARVVATGRQMYKDATNTKLDRGLAKVVGAGDKIGNSTRKVGSAVGSTAKKAGSMAKEAGRTVVNRTLDVVNPQYGYVPTTAKSTTQNIDGMNITKSVQNYRKVKVKRG